jgi:hypothetical protein
MHRWERRLADLAYLLGSCSSTYFEPDLFRLNTNQFLTTARTVTFLIQKDKALIPDFSHWYSEAVLKPWSGDPLMTWAKDSRNQIEKEGDLELHSQLSVRLIYSYLEEQDLVLTCSRPEVVGANVKRLIRFAEKRLPTGISDAAVLKIERRWVANSLPGHELLQTLIYIYSRIRSVAASLATHLGGELHHEIADPTDFDEVSTGDKLVRYIKFSDRHPSSMVTKRVYKDTQYQPPPWLQVLCDNRPKDDVLRTLSDRVKFFGKIAQGTFEQFGNHVPMLYLFGPDGEVVDFLGIIPDDQATKYIFWRTVGDRITYLGATSLIWVSEMWIRDMSNRYAVPIRKMPIKGEMLQVIGLGIGGQVEAIHWDIVRECLDVKPKLSLRTEVISSSDLNEVFYFLAPARRAFERVPGSAAQRNLSTST